jgi:tetratricopeptide (TPR) repeat protein
MLGAEHPDTATSLNTLALVLHSQGDYEAAQPLIERALTIREKMLGTQHHYTAHSLSSLAALLHSQGDYVPALPLYERALDTYEKVLGAEHPDTKICAEGTAKVLDALGRADEAAARRARFKLPPAPKPTP